MTINMLEPILVILLFQQICTSTNNPGKITGN